jgi:hypothetical protein
MAAAFGRGCGWTPPAGKDMPRSPKWSWTAIPGRIEHVPKCRRAPRRPKLLADPDSQWHEYRGRGPITKHQAAALLKDFEIRPVVVHPTKRADLSRHGYRAAQFEDAFARFLPPEPNIRTLKRGGGGKM